jgi:hypothetical protein
MTTKWMVFDYAVDLGFLPAMLSERNPAPAREQLHHGYAHGGGWHPFRGHKLLPDNRLTYPGDPPLRPLAQTKLRDELIVLYEHAWVAIIQPDRTFEVCRMD